MFLCAFACLFLAFKNIGEMLNTEVIVLNIQ